MFEFDATANRCVRSDSAVSYMEDNQAHIPLKKLVDQSFMTRGDISNLPTIFTWFLHVVEHKKFLLQEGVSICFFK